MQSICIYNVLETVETERNAKFVRILEIMEAVQKVTTTSL